MSAQRIEIARVHAPVTALGPGNRVGVWVQGCSIGCSGCASRDTWAPGLGSVWTVHEVAARVAVLVASLPDGPVGLSITGGEPLEQAGAVEELVEQVRALVGVEIDVLVFTGLPISRVRDDHPSILGCVDAIVAGPYNSNAAPKLALRSSANQVLEICSPLGEVRYDELRNQAFGDGQVQIAAYESELLLIGLTKPGDLAQLEEGLRARGVVVDRASWRPEES